VFPRAQLHANLRGFRQADKKIAGPIHFNIENHFFGKVFRLRLGRRSIGPAKTIDQALKQIFRPIIVCDLARQIPLAVLRCWIAHAVPSATGFTDIGSVDPTLGLKNAMIQACKPPWADNAFSGVLQLLSDYAT
jgi:hypothetical protein